MERPPAMNTRYRTLALAAAAFAWFAGTVALALARVDAFPGVRTTAAFLLAAWAPLALPVRRSWARELCVYLTFALVLVHLGWWAVWDLSTYGFPLPPDAERQEGVGFVVRQVNPWNGDPAWRDGFLHYLRLAVGLVMAGLLGCFHVVWRALHRELRSPGRDSGGQVAVIAGAWLAMAGCAGALDAFTRPDAALWVLQADPPPTTPIRPSICQDSPTRVYTRETYEALSFCRDLTRPRLQRAAGGLSAGIGALGALVAVAAAMRSRRRERWLERVAAGAIDGWSLVRYAPEWGELEAIPRVIGGEPPVDPKWNELAAVPRRIDEGPPVDPALTTLVVHQVLRQREGAGYRAAPEDKRIVWGRLDAALLMAALRLARRGEEDVGALVRPFAWTFVLAIVPMALVRWLGGMIVGH
jgi:hypothetical protein